MINKKMLEENGSVTVIVTVTILFFITILSATYAINATMRKTQIKSEIQMKQTYETPLNEVNEIYANMIS